jgi:hypothetical protein
MLGLSLVLAGSLTWGVIFSPGSGAGVFGATPGEETAPKPSEPATTGTWRRPAEPGVYETIRATSVFEEPEGSSRKVATINKGARVTVVGSAGGWLEVRSRHGNPPGFIRRDDAMYMEGKD